MVERGARLFASLGSSGEDFAETVNGSGHVVVDCSMVTTVCFPPNSSQISVACFFVRLFW
jgi:hypothetical protein